MLAGSQAATRIHLSTDSTRPASATAAAHEDAAVHLQWTDGYRFEVQFEPSGMPALHTDLGPPLGAHQGPNPERLLAAAVANCLAASLLFTLRKFAQEPGALRARAVLHMARNQKGRLRVGGIAVDLHLGAAAAAMPRLERALAQFEDFCSVTESVRLAFPVQVQVFDGAGVLVGPPPPAQSERTVPPQRGAFAA